MTIYTVARKKKEARMSRGRALKCGEIVSVVPIVPSYEQTRVNGTIFGLRECCDVIHPVKLQALVYDILPSTTAVFSYISFSLVLKQ